MNPAHSFDRALAYLVITMLQLPLVASGDAISLAFYLATGTLFACDFARWFSTIL